MFIYLYVATILLKHASEKNVPHMNYLKHDCLQNTALE